MEWQTKSLTTKRERKLNKQEVRAWGNDVR